MSNSESEEEFCDTSEINPSQVQYCKIPKYPDTQYLCCTNSKTQTKGFYHGIMTLANNADGIANSCEPDHTHTPYRSHSF